MSAQTIKGITVVIDGDVTKLDKALKDVIDRSADTQAELTKVNRLLKFDPTNTELLAQKQDLLKDRISQTSEKLKILNSTQADVKKQFEAGEIDGGQYRAFQREIADSEALLKSFNKELGITATKSNDLNTLGKNAENLGNKFKTASTYAAGMLAGVGAMVVKSAEYSDDLNTMAKITGLTTEEIQKIKYASDRVDVSFETVSGSLKKLTKSMGSAQDGTGAQAEAFKALKVSTTNADGSLRTSKEVFDDVVDSLGKVANETERDILAQELLGKSAADLNPLIEAGSAAFNDIGDEMKDLVIPQEDLDKMNEANDNIDKIKAQVGQSFTKLGGEIAIDLLPFIERLAEIVTNVSKAFGNMSGPMRTTIIVVLTIIAAIAPLLLIFGKLAQSIVAISKAMPLLKLGIEMIQGGFAKLLLFLAANPFIIWMVAIAAVVAAFVWAYNNVTWFREGVNSAVKAIVGFFVDLGTWIMNIFTGIGSFINDVFVVGFSAAMSTLKDLVSVYVDGIMGVFGGIQRTIQGILDFVTGVFTGDWKKAWEGVKNIFGGIFDSLSSIIKTPINAIIAIINGMVNAINNSLGTLSFKVPDWIPLIGGNKFTFPKIPTVPYLDVGTNYVARSGLAYIHEGEAIVPKKYNPQQGGGTINANITLEVPLNGRILARETFNISGDYQGLQVKRLKGAM